MWFLLLQEEYTRLEVEVRG